MYLNGMKLKFILIFQANEGMLKSSWKQLRYFDIFTKPVAVDFNRFVYLFVANGEV